VGVAVARYFDLALLAAALPVFIVAGFSMLGYAAAAGAWLAQHVVLHLAERHAAQAIERGDRNRAMGAIGFATLGRLWLVTGTILVVGLAGDREAGLTAAVLCVVLVTAHLAGLALVRIQGMAGTSASKPPAADAERSSRRGNLGRRGDLA
jgi:hypothetical protein